MCRSNMRIYTCKDCSTRLRADQNFLPCYEYRRSLPCEMVHDPDDIGPVRPGKGEYAGQKPPLRCPDCSTKEHRKIDRTGAQRKREACHSGEVKGRKISGTLNVAPAPAMNFAYTGTGQGPRHRPIAPAPSYGANQGYGANHGYETNQGGETNQGYHTNQGYGSNQGYVNPGGSRVPPFSEASATSSVGHDTIEAPVDTLPNPPNDDDDDDDERPERIRHMHIDFLMNPEDQGNSAQQAASEDGDGRSASMDLQRPDEDPTYAGQGRILHEAAPENDEHGSGPMEFSEDSSDDDPVYERQDSLTYDAPAKPRRHGQ